MTFEAFFICTQFARNFGFKLNWVLFYKNCSVLMFFHSLQYILKEYHIY